MTTAAPRALTRLTCLTGIWRIFATSRLVHRTADAPLRPGAPSGMVRYPIFGFLCGPCAHLLSMFHVYCFYLSFILLFLCLTMILDYMTDSSASTPNGRMILQVHNPRPKCAHNMYLPYQTRRSTPSRALDSFTMSYLFSLTVMVTLLGSSSTIRCKYINSAVCAERNVIQFCVLETSLPAFFLLPPCSILPVRCATVLLLFFPRTTFLPFSCSLGYLGYLPHCMWKYPFISKTRL